MLPALMIKNKEVSTLGSGAPRLQTCKTEYQHLSDQRRLPFVGDPAKEKRIKPMGTTVVTTYTYGNLNSEESVLEMVVRS